MGPQGCWEEYTHLGDGAGDLFLPSERLDGAYASSLGYIPLTRAQGPCARYDSPPVFHSLRNSGCLRMRTLNTNPCSTCRVMAFSWEWRLRLNGVVSFP